MAPDQTDHLPTFLEAITVPGAEQQQRLKQMHEVREVETPAMTYDIVEKLRSNSMEGSLMDEAASLITTLRAERDALETEVTTLQQLARDQTKYAGMATAASQALVQSMREALEKIACRHVTEQPLWWQLEARAALSRSEV